MLTCVDCTLNSVRSAHSPIPREVPPEEGAAKGATSKRDALRRTRFPRVFSVSNMSRHEPFQICQNESRNKAGYFGGSHMSFACATCNFGLLSGLCYCWRTLMCPAVFVVLPSLKVGSRDGTSSIVCSMCPKTSGPRPSNFNVYIEAANDLQRHCCSLLLQTHVTGRLCVNMKLGVGSFLERWCWAAHYTISSYERLYSLKFFIFK